jgi:hypothetical protein
MQIQIFWVLSVARAVPVWLEVGVENEAIRNEQLNNSTAAAFPILLRGLALVKNHSCFLRKQSDGALNFCQGRQTQADNYLQDIIEMRTAVIYSWSLAAGPQQLTISFGAGGAPTLRNPNVLEGNFDLSPGECTLCPKPNFIHHTLPNVSFTIVIVCLHHANSYDYPIGLLEQMAPPPPLSCLRLQAAMHWSHLRYVVIITITVSLAPEKSFCLLFECTTDRTNIVC